MRLLGRISYWAFAVSLLAVILESLGYSITNSFLLALLFCPCAIALEFAMPKTERLLDKVYLSIAVLISATLLILILHECIWTQYSAEGFLVKSAGIPPVLGNPVFLGLILSVMALGDYGWKKKLSDMLADKPESIIFCSDRKNVTLPLKEIAFIESNDTEVRIVTVQGESFRNKTGIGRWENLLGEDFLRTHRSYLVNRSLASLDSSETVIVAGSRIPVSRKYREKVSGALPKPAPSSHAN